MTEWHPVTDTPPAGPLIASDGATEWHIHRCRSSPFKNALRVKTWRVADADEDAYQFVRGCE